jgi:LPS-assembly protein
MAILRAPMYLSFLGDLPQRGGLRLNATFLLLSGLAATSWAQQAPPPPELQGPGKDVVMRSDTQQKDKDTYHFRGHVEIIYESMHLHADEASYDAASGEVMARGHVVFDDPKSHLVAEEVHYNVRTRQGWFSNGTGFVHPRAQPRPRVLRTENPFYVSGSTVDRLDEDTYLVHHGRLTSCDCEKKGWSLSTERASVVVDDKLVAHDAVFRLLDIPFFYFPFLEESIAREPRQTGFLLPHIGNSTQKGFIIGDGFFWAINPSTDLMLGLEDFSKRGISERGEFRARPSADSSLNIEYFGVNDKYANTSLRAPGESLHAVGKDDDLGDGFRGALSVDYVNTMAFRLTWSSNFTEAVSSEAVSSGFVTKNFDAYSLNISAERYENFLSTEIVPGNAVIIRHAPSVEFSGEDKEIGDSPVYYSFDAQADAVGRTEAGLTLPFLSDRLYIHPQLLLRPKEFWHIHFTPLLGFQATQYGTSLTPTHAPINRLLGEVGFDLRPPSLERVFTKPIKGHRLKHVIEPDIQYHLVRATDPQNIFDIVRFDQLDIFTETNEIEYSLTNTILARQVSSDGTSNSSPARDIFSWRLSEKYYFDPTFGGALTPGQTNVFDSTIELTGFAFARGQRLSPVVSVFKFAPFSNFDTELRTDISPTGNGDILNAGITSHVKHGLFGLAFTDFFIDHTALLNIPTAPTVPVGELPSFHLLNALVTYGDVNRKGFSGAFGLDYNFAQKIAQQTVGQVSYNFGCFGIDVEFRQFDLGPLRHESQFRVALALANVGTFGNLKPRERLY